MKTKLDCRAGWRTLVLEELTRQSSRQFAEAGWGAKTRKLQW